MRRLNAMLATASFALAMPAAGIGQDGALQELDTLLGDIETMSADVTQLIVESDGGILEESLIRMLLKRPNGFYWETIEPFPELIVTDGITLWNYQPDLEQVVIEDWNSDESELAAQLLSGRTDNLGEEYVVMNVSETGSDHQEFALKPRASESVYEEININFLAGNLDMIYLHSKNGQQTVWRFDSMDKNLPLDDSRFVFEPPDGIEVIENTYAQ